MTASRSFTFNRSGLEAFSKRVEAASTSYVAAAVDVMEDVADVMHTTAYEVGQVDTGFQTEHVYENVEVSEKTITAEIAFRSEDFLGQVRRGRERDSGEIITEFYPDKIFAGARAIRAGVTQGAQALNFRLKGITRARK